MPIISIIDKVLSSVDVLLDHPDVVGISFVGSTPVARYVYRRAAEQGKRVQCHGGAKNFLVVLPDADWDRAVPAIVGSAYGCAGQRCLAGSAVIAVGDAYEKLLARVLPTVSKLRVGNGLDPETQMGPVISPSAKERICEYLERGEKEGALLRVDGRTHPLARQEEGFYLGPSVFAEVKPGMTIAREEIFGPVLSVLPAPSLEEALEIIRQNPYGNAASIFTQNGKAARTFQHEVSCGNVGINVGVAAPMAFFPFAGRKASFFGDLHGQGRDAIRFFTDAKVVIERW